MLSKRLPPNGPGRRFPVPESAAVDDLLPCCPTRMSLSAVDLPKWNEPLDRWIWPAHHTGAHLAPARGVHLAHRVRAGRDRGDDRDVAVVAVQTSRPIDRDRADRWVHVGA